MTATATASIPRKRILFVDDDEDTQELMLCLLGEYGYEVVIAGSVENALECAKSGELDLCILDLWFSESSGIDLCQQIRTYDPDTPIVFYSGAGYRTDIEKGMAAGAQAYLVKPDLDRLTDAIHRLLDEPTVH